MCDTHSMNSLGLQKQRHHLKLNAGYCQEESKKSAVFLPLLHSRRRMIKPRQIANNCFVVSVVAFADLHGSDLSQTDLQIPSKRVFVQRLTARFHVALSHKHNTFQQTFNLYCFNKVKTTVFKQVLPSAIG